MYTSLFGFKENPFNLTPDPRYLFLSTYHREALDHLLYGINERKGFIVITGGIGTGKTTLCRALLGHLDSSIKSALIFNAFISDMELLENINQELGLDVEGYSKSKKDYIDRLNQALLETFGRGGNTVLLIDEAQNLSHTVLEQIRMLSNLETEREKLLQIVLVGQPELREVLATPSLRQLDERIMVRYDLRPLDPKDIRGYVEHRLVVAGGRGNVGFTKGAYKKIYEYSQGNPRRINAVCDRALLIAFAKEKYTISKGITQKAIEELHGSIRLEPRPLGWSWNRVAALVILLLLLIVGAGFAGWSFRDYIMGMFAGTQQAAIAEIDAEQSRATEPKKEPATLFLDEKTSLSGLFALFSQRERGQETSQMHLSLVSFRIDPEYYVTFKKPFRVLVSEAPPDSLATPRYLLIRDVTEGGVIAIDDAGNERLVDRDFILKHWGRKVSWIYPYENKDLYLTKGTSVPAVLKVQRMLSETGYLIEPTGIFDESTSQELMRFQTDFGLMADGIAGPRTRALLFQMTD